VREILGIKEDKAPFPIPEVKPFRRENIAIKVLRGLENFRFWADQWGDGYISISPYKHLRVGSSEFKEWLQSQTYKAEGKTLHNQALSEIVEVCKYWAREGEKRTVWLRVGNAEGLVEVSLVGGDGRVLRITPEGALLTLPSLTFVTPKHFLPLPPPDFDVDHREDWKWLFKVINVEKEEDQWLVLAWVLKTFWSEGEFPLLAFMGEREGIGKTVSARFIKELLDPTATLIKPLPRGEEELRVLAKNNFILLFDNIGHLSDELSDELCRLSTGGGIAKRRLYTDTEVVEFTLKNPVILTAVVNVLKNRDLRRRAIVIELRKPKRFMQFGDLKKEFEKVRPKVYG